MKTIEERINEYFNWLKQNYIFKELDSSTEITTPFKNHLNDFIRIYADTLPNNEICLSDDGLTINELEMLGIDINTKTRTKLIQNILNQFNLKLVDKEITADVKNESFAQSKHNLIQGILKIYDLTLTTKSNVTNIFYEEVFEFLYDREIRGLAQVSVSGESGLKYSIDYIVSETKSQPEKLVNFTNNLDFNKITNEAYIYRDIKPNRPSRNKLEPIMLIIVNDVDHPINERAQTVAEHENLEILKWSNKSKIIETLTS
ncbi:TPA: DUF1828 domain-containing protein [Staphylococcus aureus]